MNKLILLSGKKFVGKDTVADLLADLGYRKFAIADTLKCDLSVFIKNVLGERNFNYKDLWSTEKKETPITIAGKTTTLRQMMQWFGQAMKSFFGESYWVDLLVSNLKNHALVNKDKIIITDCRFEYELSHLIEKLSSEYSIFTIRIKRDTNIIDNDVSETHLDAKPDEDFDFVIHNNGTKSDLANRVEDIIAYIK